MEIPLKNPCSTSKTISHQLLGSRWDRPCMPPPWTHSEAPGSLPLPCRRDASDLADFPPLRPGIPWNWALSEAVLRSSQEFNLILNFQVRHVSPEKSPMFWTKDKYPLVNVYITMENHHFSWENPLFLWSFSIAILTLPEGKLQLLPECYRMLRWPTCPPLGR